MQIKVIILLVICFVVAGEARTLYISAETGTLSETPPVPDPTLNGMKKMQRGVASVVALWVTNPSWQGNMLVCNDAVDAYFNEQTQLYQVPQWAVFSQQGGDQGSAEILIEIYDLDTFVAYAFTQGVWVNPDNCQAIWDLMLQYVIAPLINGIATQGRPTLTARDNGIAVYLMCKPVDAADWLVCSADDYHKITHAYVNIHTPKLRTYKNLY